MTSPSSSLEWAKTLVGRDWEIFWSQDDDGDSSDNGASEKEKKNATTNEKQATKSKDEADAESDEESDAESDESYYDDWYAGHVHSMRKLKGGEFSFEVRFVGEEDDIYSMTLDSSKVRPSARGWIKRTRSIMCVGGECSSSTKVWESKLPPDTRTINDEPKLDELQKELETESFQEFSVPQNGTNYSFRLPSLQDLAHVRRLRYLLRVQVLLRTSLAKIENHHGSTKLFVDGEPNPTEGYVDHLVTCLESFEKVCIWYCNSWRACQALFINEEKKSRSDGEEISKEQMTLRTIVKDFLEVGRVAVTALVSMDTSPAAAKRRQPVTAGTRRTKRRRKNMRFGNSKESLLETFDETDFHSTGGVDQFVQAMYSNDGRWFLRQFGSMLQTLSHCIVDPIITWQRNADLLLREKSSDLEENRPSDDEASEEQQDDSDSDGSDDMSEDENEQFFSYDDIKQSLSSVHENSILSRIDLSEIEEKLKNKLSEIETFEYRVSGLLGRIMDEDDEPSKSNDEVLHGLREVSRLASSVDHAVSNIEPLGSSSSPITRDVLADAVFMRTWLLDLRHAEKVRERAAFIESLLSRAKQLPDLPASTESPSNDAAALRKRKAAIDRLHSLSSGYAKHVSICEKYHSDVKDRKVDGTGKDLMSKNGTSAAIAELRKMPLISAAEEKIVVRVDVLTWNENVEGVLVDKDNLPEYDTLIGLNESLQLILDGKSRTRSELLQHVEENDEVEADVRSFARNDVEAICGTLSGLVDSLYSKASKWKERADSVISSLRMYGNAAAGEFLDSHKLPAMIDIKRIRDLLDAYEELRVSIPGYTKILESVTEDADKWSVELEKSVIEETHPFPQSLSILEEQRDRRPRGIIMDPTRHVFDMLLDLLGWHKRVTESLMKLAEDAERIVIPNTSDTEALAKYSTLVGDIVYPLLIDGCEVVEAYSEKRDASGEVNVRSSRCVQALENMHELRKTARALSREKLESNPLGSALLGRMVRSQPEAVEGAPLFLMLWFYWDLLVEEFVAHCSESSDEEDDDDDDDDEESSMRDPRSLTEAKQLKAMEPSLMIAGEKTNIPKYVENLLRCRTSDQIAFDSIIKEAEEIESEVRASLTATKDMLRGSLKKADAVRDHLANLKELQNRLKKRAKKRIGVCLNPAIEPQLDYHIRIFTWLVRTFTYPLLHLDEASYSAPVDSDDDENDSGPRIPYDVLIGLHERIPGSAEERTGDFALIALRVSELYEAAKTWQDEITSTTMISIRGGKRRGQSNQSSRGNETEQDAASQLGIGKVQQLALNPILSKVVMPREGAVNGILKTSKQFEVQLRNFLGKDYEGTYADLAPYPDSESLVGRRGEFVLYRLTQSSLFVTLRATLQSISHVAENLLAETPGKVAFEWIQSAVLWIEELNDAVTTESPFEGADINILTIPGSEAREILKEGEAIFLNLPDDLRKTLSRHRIFVSTNKQDGKFKVVFKKGGVPHSVGGTAIRWCPLLFECLRSDVARLDDWEKDLTRILGNFNRFFSETRSHTKGDENNLYRWHEFREQVSELLEEGLKSLVVSPQKGLVDSFRKLLNSINNNLERHSTKELDRSFERRKFEQSTSLVDERFILLECLLYRKSEAEKLNDTAIPQNESFENASQLGQAERSFRDTCRLYIEKALTRGLKVLGMDSMSNNGSEEEMGAYCAIKAWEIENEMFDRFQNNLGTSRVSDEYRDKARSLRYNLEDKNNPTLCPQVLIGDIDAAKLVSMTSDQLASQKVKFVRAMAEETRKRAVVLTRNPIVESSSSDKQHVEMETKKNAAIKTPPVNDSQDLSSKEPALPNVHRDVDSSASVDSNSKSPDEAKILSSNTINGNGRDVLTSNVKLPSKIVISSSRSSRPPPPPSLAATIQNNPSTVALPPPPPVSQGATTRYDRGKRITNAIGGDRFQIEIMKPRIVFLAGFYLEDDSMAGVNSFLPEILSEKGRLKIDDFQKFVAEKLSGGRWLAIPLRLTTYSDYDAQEYKKFYKEYESKKRIAMFGISGQQNSKVFLVTPKFHGAATASGLIPLTNKYSTYALVLTKERLRS